MEEEEGEKKRTGWDDKRRMRGGGGGQRGMVSVTRPVILQREGERIPAAPDSSCSSSVFSALQAEQTGLMLVNVSFVLDVRVFLSLSLTHSLHIQRQMFLRWRRRRVAEWKAWDGRVALGGASNWPLDGGAVTEWGTSTHTHTRSPLSVRLSSLIW